MPLLAYAVISYAAGLLTGFGGFAASGGAAAAVAAVGSLAAGRRTHLSFAAVFAAGLLIGLSRSESPRARPPAEGTVPALARIRAGAGERIDATFGADAPLVRALLIADQRAVDPAVRDRFAAAGIVHMLSISGLHVAIIAAAIRVLALALRLRAGAAMAATMAVVTLYVAVIGAPAPALRSAVMLGAAALARLAQRPTSAWGVLAIGAGVPLLAPATVTDLGYQLSVLGMASLIAGGNLARRVIAPRLDGWRASAASLALISTIATVVSAPIVAWYFGRVSLIAPLTNIAATPVVGLLQPMLFLALALTPWPAAAALVADAAHPLLALFGVIADRGAALPGAAIAVAPTLPQAALACAAAIALLVACANHFPSRPLAVALAAGAVALWLPEVIGRPGGLEIHVIDVGQGDAIALRTPAGHWIVTDAGRDWSGGDAGRATVVPYLRRYGGAVALFVLTHPHADHAGGAASLLRALHPRAYWDGAYAGTSESYRASLLAADSAHIPWRRVHPGDSLALDGVVLRVLAPDSAWTASLADPNEASVVTLVEYGSVRLLLAGDAERGEEDRLVARYGGGLRADILKVGHHGSRTSSTAALLAAVRPRLALISVGARNTYGHPSPEVLHALTRAGAAVLRTDAEGTIVVRTDGAAIEVEEAGERWVLARGAP